MTTKLPLGRIAIDSYEQFIHFSRMQATLSELVSSFGPGLLLIHGVFQDGRLIRIDIARAPDVEQPEPFGIGVPSVPILQHREIGG